MYEEALKNCDRLLTESGVQDKRVRALQITIRFNMACCHEKACRIGEASEMLKSIIKDEPSYTDAYMRIAYLAKRRGDMKRALEYIEQGKQNHSRSDNRALPIKLYCMKGRLLTDLGRFQEAFKEFHKALEMSGKRDAYARMGLANIHYETSTVHRSNIEIQE